MAPPAARQQGMRMIYNLGSINADKVYHLPHLPAPGETLAALRHVTGLGGKGANQSVAAARAGATVAHIGAVGPDGDWMVRALSDEGVDTAHVARLDTPSGHAVILVDPDGENAIVIHPGANRALPPARIAAALASAAPADWLMLQNETALTAEAARMARAKGMQVAYSAAPFDAAAVRDILPHVTLLMLNAVEAEQLSQALGFGVTDIPVPRLLITRGADGALWHDRTDDTSLRVPALPVTPVDTTGAGDTFAGYLVAGLSRGLAPSAALTRAAAAAALSVTRPGAADAIPTAAEVAALSGRGQ